MSFPLFISNIKSNRTTWLIMLAVYSFYYSIIISMYDPEGLDAWDEMLGMMPEGFVQAFGWDMMGSTLTAMIGTALYGFLVYLFPMVVSIVVNHRLLATHIDKGSMAYLLATPNSRKTIAVTQAMFSLASITLFFTLVTGVGIGISEAMFPGELEIRTFILLNLYTIVNYFAIGGIGFLASSIAHESKHSLGIGIGLPMGFLVLQMLGNSDPDISWVGNLSMFALFDPGKLIDGNTGFVFLSMGALLAIAALLYGVGINWFTRRDFHI